jgi:hypothetical protein
MVWILTDPDVLNNYGLLKGDNLKFSLNLIAALTKDNPKRTIVFYEPPGSYQTPNQPRIDWKKFLKPGNLAIIIISFIVAILLAYFGLHKYWPEETNTEKVKFGKLTLIQNSARLITLSNRKKEIFQKYLDLSVDDLGKLLHVPKTALKDRNELLRILDAGRIKVSNKKPSELYFEAIKNADALSPSQLLNYAKAFHQMKEELESGSGTFGKHNDPR